MQDIGQGFCDKPRDKKKSKNQIYVFEVASVWEPYIPTHWMGFPVIGIKKDTL